MFFGTLICTDLQLIAPRKSLQIRPYRPSKDTVEHVQITANHGFEKNNGKTRKTRVLQCKSTANQVQIRVTRFNLHCKTRAFRALNSKSTYFTVQINCKSNATVQIRVTRFNAFRCAWFAVICTVKHVQKHVFSSSRGSVTFKKHYKTRVFKLSEPPNLQKTL